jgi:hypothetical protein
VASLDPGLETAGKFINHNGFLKNLCKVPSLPVRINAGTIVVTSFSLAFEKILRISADAVA